MKKADGHLGRNTLANGGHLAKCGCCVCGSCSFARNSRLRVYGIVEYCPLDVCPGGAYIGGAERFEFEAYLDFVSCGAAATVWQGAGTTWTSTHYLGGGCPPTTLFDTTTPDNPYSHLGYDCSTNEWFDADAPTTRWSGDCHGFLIPNWQAGTPEGCNGTINYTHNYLKVEVVDNEKCEDCCGHTQPDAVATGAASSPFDCDHVNGSYVFAGDSSGDTACTWSWTNVTRPGAGMVVTYDRATGKYKVEIMVASTPIIYVLEDAPITCVGGVLIGSFDVPPWGLPPFCEHPVTVTLG